MKFNKNHTHTSKKYVLWKDITLILIIKGILFFILWFIFFSHPNSQHINTNQAYVNHLLNETKES